MKRSSLFAGVLVAGLLAGTMSPAVFAQGTGGPFADVPVDHWAYKAVDKLQHEGIVIGYPDGTFGGKRAMTRYEFAVAIARLLEKIPPPYVAPPPPDLTPYVKKDDMAGYLAPYALKTDLAPFAKQADLDTLKKLVDEFTTELTTLGVDLDAVKHRLDALEGRVNALDAELHRVQVYGTVNVMGIGYNTVGKSTSPTDADGYFVTKGSSNGTPNNTFYDTYVLHDIDLGVRARISPTATADVVVNYGNYMPYLGGIASYSNSVTGTSYTGRSPIDDFSIVDQEESFNVYKATIQEAARIPYIGGVGVTVGRMPMQLTPYTLKLIDVDSYFYNDKTSLGDIPVDGGKLTFKLGPIGLTGFAAKTDPISFVSDENDSLKDATGTGGYGIFAGAGSAPFSKNGILSTNGLAGSFRPVGSLINPNDTLASSAGFSTSTMGNGAMRVEELAGGRVGLDISHLNIGVTYLALGGDTETPSLLLPQDAVFNRVFVYGGDVSGSLNKLIGIQGSWTESDTGGPHLTSASTVDIGTSSDITKNNSAWDAALKLTPGSVTITGGYKEIDPYFAAPGYWDKIGSWTNPVDIKGPYVTGKIAITHALDFEAAGKFYEGTGQALGAGGLSTQDKITNWKAGFKYALTAPSSIGLGIEETQYKFGEGPVGIDGVTPTEYLINAGYGYSFTPASSFKVGYQWINYEDKGTGFGDPLPGSDQSTGSQRGGVAYTQFSVKF